MVRDRLSALGPADLGFGALMVYLSLSATGISVCLRCQEVPIWSRAPAATTTIPTACRHSSVVCVTRECTGVVALLIVSVLPRSVRMAFNGDGPYNKRMRTDAESGGQKVCLLGILNPTKVFYFAWLNGLFGV